MFVFLLGSYVICDVDKNETCADVVNARQFPFVVDTFGHSFIYADGQILHPLHGRPHGDCGNGIGVVAIVATICGD